LLFMLAVGTLQASFATGGLYERTEMARPWSCVPRAE
jgi:hypothetical protein